MRMIVGTLAITALVGCTSQDEVALEHRNLQEIQARGVVLDDSGDVANVGMNGTTCDFQTQAGVIQSDYDYAGSNETVVDGGVPIDFVPVEIVLTPDLVGLTTPDLFPSNQTFEIPGVLDAAVLDGGFAVVQAAGAASSCDIAWHSFDGQLTDVVHTDLDCSTASMSADDASGVVFLSSATGVHKIEREGSVTAIDSSPGALIAWDASADTLYVSAIGSELLSAFESDGAVRWSSPVNGEIASLTEMGDTGRVAISLSNGNAGEFVVIDGLSGLTTASLGTPSAAREMNISGNGRVLAVSLASAVHYFDITAQ